VTKNLAQLTGLRGLAAVIVFISHAANENFIPGVFGKGYGQLGVMLFFVLSGFLMAYLYIGKDSSLENIKAFLIARVGRVVPLYFTLVIFSYLVKTNIYNEFHYDIDNIRVLLSSLFFLKAPNEFWTIPIEFQFYITFLLIWMSIFKFQNYRVIPITWFIVLSPTIIYFLMYGELLQYLPTYFNAFMFGVLISFMYSKICGSSLALKIANWTGGLFLLLFLINLPVLRMEYDLVLSQRVFLRTWGDPINWIIIVGLFCCALMGSKSLVVLETKAFQYLGKISYAFYLLHYPVLTWVQTYAVNGLFKFMMAFLLIVVLSHISGIIIETPANKLIRRIGKL